MVRFLIFLGIRLYFKSIAYDKYFLSYDPECRNVHRNTDFFAMSIRGKSVYMRSRIDSLLFLWHMNFVPVSKKKRTRSEHIFPILHAKIHTVLGHGVDYILSQWKPRRIAWKYCCQMHKKLKFRNLANCATFNDASLQAAKDEDPNDVHWFLRTCAWK